MTWTSVIKLIMDITLNIKLNLHWRWPYSRYNNWEVRRHGIVDGRNDPPIPLYNVEKPSPFIEDLEAASNQDLKRIISSGNKIESWLHHQWLLRTEDLNKAKIKLIEEIEKLKDTEEKHKSILESASKRINILKYMYDLLAVIFCAIYVFFASYIMNYTDAVLNKNFAIALTFGLIIVCASHFAGIYAGNHNITGIKFRWRFITFFAIPIVLTIVLVIAYWQNGNGLFRRDVVFMFFLLLALIFLHVLFSYCINKPLVLDQIDAKRQIRRCQRKVNELLKKKDVLNEELLELVEDGKVMRESYLQKIDYVKKEFVVLKKIYEDSNIKKRYDITEESNDYPKSYSYQGTLDDKWPEPKWLRMKVDGFDISCEEEETE